MHRLLNTMLMIKQHSLKVKQFMRLQLTFFSLHRALRLLLATYSTSKHIIRLFIAQYVENKLNSGSYSKAGLTVLGS